jgi:D-beta-D-heptose 7-phosphate kinase/D-beta-D-heptose 1-phosphate adenosyltransferase
MSKDIQQLKPLKILVIGDSCKDIYRFGYCERISPEAPVPILKIDSCKEYFGMAANVFQNIKSLGNEAFLFTQEEKIIKTRIVEKKFNHHILRIDEEPKVTPLDWKKYNGPSLDVFDGFVISDYDKGFLNKKSVEKILNKIKKYKKPIFVDSKKKNLSVFKNCIIKINEHEFNQARSIPKDSELIVTYGSKGAIWKKKLFPSNKTEVFDVCGAGDTFLSALVNLYLKTSDMERSIKFANYCASVSVKNFGTYCINLEDLNGVKI